MMTIDITPYGVTVRTKDDDGEHWITVHPDGPDTKGEPVLLGKGGVVKGGLGGAFLGFLQRLLGPGPGHEVIGFLARAESQPLNGVS